jgi:homogentisate 1,2-dioxygenase
MEYVPKMIAPTSTGHQVHGAYEEQLDGWHSSGRPPKGFYSYKLEFGAEILRESPPTIIGSADRYEDRSDFRELLDSEKPREATALHRRAFEITALDNDTFAPVLWSEDLAVWSFNGQLGQDDTRRAWRHGDCHELLFVHAAEEPFSIITDFGLLENVGTGDFVYLPRGTTYAFSETEDVSILAYEVPEPIYRPYDYWMGDQQPWPYSPDAPRRAEPAGRDPLTDGDKEPIREVVVKRRLGDYTVLSYDTPVFDTVAWEGELWPFALNLEDINVLTSPDFHLDPPKVTLFVSESEGMYLQTFLPRWMQSPPYNHLNKVDEALFNHSGYEARPEIGDGFMTLHPAGVPHGPDPRVVKELANEEPPEGDDIPWASEIGIMVEAATPFSVLGPGDDVEKEGYGESWSEIAEQEDIAYAE